MLSIFVIDSIPATLAFWFITRIIFDLKKWSNLSAVIEYKDSLLKFYERNYFEVGDLVEVFTPSGEHINFVVSELFDEDMNPVDVARHPDNIYYLKMNSDLEIPEYSMIKIVKRK